MDMWIKVFYDMSANAILPTTAAFAIAAFKADFDLPLQTQIANGFV